jgi:hypothetical protein
MVNVWFILWSKHGHAWWTERSGARPAGGGGGGGDWRYCTASFSVLAILYFNFQLKRYHTSIMFPSSDSTSRQIYTSGKEI